MDIKIYITPDTPNNRKRLRDYVTRKLVDGKPKEHDIVYISPSLATNKDGYFDSEKTKMGYLLTIKDDGTTVLDNFYIKGTEVVFNK